MGNKSIVITSIFPPTEAVIKFAALNNYKVIVVGDLKTPNPWQCGGVQYLSTDWQSKCQYKLAKDLPFNHYGRKMLGYLEAKACGAEYIIDTDDDNIPYANWDFPSFEGNFLSSAANLGFVNMYKSFTSAHIWPRGFPLNLIQNPEAQLHTKNLQTSNLKIGVWQGLADEDPDVDAIYRLTSNQPCFFDKAQPIVLQAGTICPFNSQNTMFRKELFPLLYLPAFVSFRFTDILRGLIAQPIMNLYDYHLGFTQATVIQKRNPHNYLKDFESEINCYLYPEKIIEIVAAAISKNCTLNDNLFNAYKALELVNLIEKRELNLLDLWLEEI